MPQIGQLPGFNFVNCILEGMPVSTPSGFVPIEELREGDMILTSKGTSTRITAMSCDSIKWKDAQPLENAIVFKVPAGELGAKMDAYLSYWHRIWHKDAWHTAASLGLAKAKKEEVCSADSNEIYRLYNLATEDPEDGFVICGGLKVEAWSGKPSRLTGGFRMHNGVPAMINA